MTTLAEEIARCLAEGHCSTAMSGGGKRFPGPPLTDEDKAFLHRWAGALHKQEWKRNAEKFPNPDRLIFRVIHARRSAEDDKASAAKEDRLEDGGRHREGGAARPRPKDGHTGLYPSRHRPSLRMGR
jgi:hypothetical protein